MGSLFVAAAGFPTFLFTTALVVVVIFWLLVAVGVTDSGSFDADVDIDAWGMGGVPVAVPFSAMTVLAWCVSLTATVLLDPVVAPGGGRAVVRVAVLAAALLVAWSLTRLLVRLWQRLSPEEPGPSGTESIALPCTGRMGRADAESGQAEAAAQDGSSAVVRIRRPGVESPTYGGTGLSHAYDDTGEFLRGAPYDATLNPLRHTA
ncbi:hypothetical protein YWIDRAFT_06260 [Streptomyces sp. SceaMP-e96]|uniref:hypothetical protein n=1 Tax=unclassified Streptomyces TaxID=2593676 RepID=UPI0008239650|nr:MULTISPECIES: hypothetical protein [unclassified Streptomyces]MYT16700.1 hypothetical protein [Streptomyces sp. SID4951]SCK34604.1 hypothetical protein YWIDRAFT_06260 [Streptomyces sp. SceaMP-e96]